MAEKLYFSMGEVAEIFDVNASLIRHWESQFSVIRPMRNKKGNRLFTAQDVEHLKVIYHLVKERGMTLEGAKKALRQHKSEGGVKRDMELMERMQRIRALLVEVREELRDDDHDGTIHVDEVDPSDGAESTLHRRPIQALEKPVESLDVKIEKSLETPNHTEIQKSAAQNISRPTETPAGAVLSLSVDAPQSAESLKLMETPAGAVENDVSQGGQAVETVMVQMRAEDALVIEAPAPQMRVEAVAPTTEMGVTTEGVSAVLGVASEPAEESPVTRKTRRKKEGAESNELFAFYEQSLF